MHRIMMASLVVVATGLGGCTSVMGPTPAPSCDGGARRPLNRSMWDWDGTKSGVPVASAIPPAANERPASAPGPSGELIIRKGEVVTPKHIGEVRGRALPSFDIAASLEPCTDKVGHG